MRKRRRRKRILSGKKRTKPSMKPKGGKKDKNMSSKGIFLSFFGRFGFIHTIYRMILKFINKVR